MPSFYKSGPQPWNVTNLGANFHGTLNITNGDGSQATRFGGIWTDTAQATTITILDNNGTGDLTKVQVHTSINQAANTLSQPPNGGCELSKGLCVNSPSTTNGFTYVYWK